MVNNNMRYKEKPFCLVGLSVFVVSFWAHESRAQSPLLDQRDWRPYICPQLTFTPDATLPGRVTRISGLTSLLECRRPSSKNCVNCLRTGIKPITSFLVVLPVR